MINKVLESGYNDSSQFPAAAVIPEFRGALDRQTLKKRASIFDAEYDKFERKPGHTYIHLISVAAGEHYGPNSRADFYNGDAYRHELSCPEKGKPNFIILKPGLSATHNKTFMEHGGVYTEHVSSLDGAEPQGYIVKAALNPEMKRGELIIGVETNKWADDIHKLESGTPLKFSIGASAPYDICSVCGHITTTEDGHCDHYKTMPGEFLADGSQVYVISDNCLFHDISRVKNPAEKIAFSIRKVASGRGNRFVTPVGPAKASVVRALCKTANAKARFDMLCKLAAIEKEILAEGTTCAVDPALLSLFRKRRAAKKCQRKEASAAESLQHFLDFADTNNIIGSCNKHDYILSPEEFVNLMLPEEDRKAYHVSIEDIENSLPGIFNKILHSTEADTFCNDDTYECDRCCESVTDAAIGNYCKTQSIGDIVGQLVDQALDGNNLQNNGDKVIITISNGVSNDVSSTIAEDYASYLVSSALRTTPEQPVLTMLGNLIK
jgi:hypothetical protein